MKQNRIFIWVTFFVFIIYLSACSHQFVADYDEQAVTDFLNISRKIDVFYGVLLETDKNQRQYQKFKKDYVEIESDFRMLLMKNNLRPYNQETISQINIAIELWQEDKQKHKEKDGINDFIAKRHRAQYLKVFLEMIKAEKVKKI